MADEISPDDLMTMRPEATPTFTVRPTPAAAPSDVSPAMRGILDQVIAPGESSGKYNIRYDGGAGATFDDYSHHPGIYAPITSGPNVGKKSSAAGKYQFLESTWEQAAKALGLTDFSPASQDAAAAWLAKKTYLEKTGRDLEADYQANDPSLRAGIRRALSGQWESLGKAGPRTDKLWTVGNDRFRFDDAAAQAHEGKDDTDLVYMKPQDYLMLSPSLEDDPGHSLTGWRDLRKSVAAGDPVRNLPTLETLDGKVTGQDGRSRALLAQTAGLDAIPVAMRHEGARPTDELVGMNGASVPTNAYAPTSQFETKKDGGSIIGRFLGISPANAAEPTGMEGNPFAQFAEPAANPFAQFAEPTNPGTDAGPWPAGEIKQVPAEGPIKHVVRAGAEALSPPYGPSDETMRPFTQGPGAVMNAVNQYGVRPVLTAADMLSRPFQAGVRGFAAAGSEVARAVGQDETQARKLERDLNVGGDVALTLGGTVPSMLPARPPTPGPLSRIGRIEASDQAKRTIEAGFVLPPAEASVGHIGKTNLTNIAAAEAGKIKSGQLASAINQPRVNVLAQQELGVQPGTPLTPQVFKQIREREGKTYDEVKEAVPEVDLGRDKQFRDAAERVGSRSKKTEELFPSTTEPPGVSELRQEMLANSRGDTNAVMNYIADLRFKATQNMRAVGNAMAHRMGAAQREAANVLEDAMERSVKNAPAYFQEKLDQSIARRAEATADFNYAARSFVSDPTSPISKQIETARQRVEASNADVKGWERRLSEADAKDAQNQTLLDRFRQARQTMAKSYDVEAVTNVSTGDVSATGLGRLLQQGKPLTGDLKLIADSANSFHRAFQNPAAFGGVEPLSVLDAAAAGALALHGHAVPAFGLLTRPLVRNTTLAPWQQRRMISEPVAGATSGMSSGLVQPGAVTGGVEGATQGMDQK